MTGTLGSSAAALRNPEHTISIVPSNKTWVATLGEFELARSDRAVVLAEAGYSPVVYFPHGDVRVEELLASKTRTHCPFKGNAVYWAAQMDDTICDVAWCYPRTFDEVSAIAGR